MIPQLETQHGHGNQDLELLSQNIKRFAKVLEDNPVLDGRLIENVKPQGRAPTDPPGLVAGDNIINHGLGRALRGWYVVRFWNPTPLTYPNPYVPGAPIPYEPYLYDKQDTNTVSGKNNTHNTLILTAAAACNVSLWVF